MMKLKFMLSLKWYDSRLQFYNLKDNIDMNSLLYEEKQKLWVPKIVFDNTESRVKSLNDADSRMIIVKLENGTLNTDGLLPNDIQIFEGRKNALVLSRVYSVGFLCTYKM